jgi:hypothetical protein
MDGIDAASKRTFAARSPLAIADAIRVCDCLKEASISGRRVNLALSALPTKTSVGLDVWLANRLPSGFNQNDAYRRRLCETLPAGEILYRMPEQVGARPHTFW